MVREVPIRAHWKSFDIYCKAGTGGERFFSAVFLSGTLQILSLFIPLFIQIKILTTFAYELNKATNNLAGI
jgi:hypothetical protein